ncbi:MAG: hypothetical protein M4579_006431 [Chaenotheca gracillima]|nr:MAG: hypothetical protein M4579_006431 [Chaenotheca gracillima]
MSTMDLPPPPYSEHDPVAGSPVSPGGGHVSPAAIPRSPHSLAPEVASPQPSPAYAQGPESADRSNSRVILTPPGTPDQYSHQVNATDQTWQPSCLPYFESRTSPLALPNDVYIHPIILSRDTQPDNLPFPEPKHVWIARDVTHTDWMTFLNYLLPHHLNAANNQVADRKLRQEAEYQAQLDSNGPHTGTQAANDLQSAQIQHLRDSRARSSPLDHQQQSAMEAVVAEWNEGFFGPRGLKIDETFSDDSRDEQANAEALRSLPGMAQPSPSQSVETLPSYSPAFGHANQNQNPNPSQYRQETYTSSCSTSSRYPRRGPLSEADVLDLSALKSAITDFVVSAHSNSRRGNRGVALNQLRDEIFEQRRQKMMDAQKEIEDATRDFKQMMENRRASKQRRKEDKHLRKAEYRAEKRLRKEVRKEAKEVEKEAKEHRKWARKEGKQPCGSSGDRGPPRRGSSEFPPATGGGFARGMGAESGVTASKASKD